MKVIITDSNFQSDLPERTALAEAGIEPVRFDCRTEDELISCGRDADAALVQFAPVTRRVLAAWTKCRLIVRYGIGTDNIDTAAAAERGIRVCNVPTYCLDEVADHTCAMLLASARKIVPLHESVRGGRWEVEPVAKPLPKLSDCVLGLVGFGRIGERVMHRLAPFGFRIRVYDPYLSDDTARAHRIVRTNALRELLAEADFVSLHLPLTDATRHLINLETLGWMKPTAVLVNTSRGALVDTAALAEALRAGRIGGAALDVFEREPLEADHPLRGCPNAILTPHAAYYSESALLALQTQAAEEVVRWAKGEPPRSPVNDPAKGR